MSDTPVDYSDFVLCFTDDGHLVGPTPTCGTWCDPTTICCDPTPATPCPPVEGICAEPSMDALAQMATALVATAIGGIYPGWCPHTVELCHPQACTCTTGCSACCHRDLLPISDGRWPIVPDSVEVRYDSPTGTVIDSATYRLVEGGQLAHLGDGWPRARRIYATYTVVGVPWGGPIVVSRLACELRKLWQPATGPCRTSLGKVATGKSPLQDSGGLLTGLLGWDPLIDAYVAGWLANPPTAPGFVSHPSITGGWTRLDFA